ncbi:hypothetical protein EPI10_008634 [Gossypium australe]|uniref:Uncharacterized protein n=1 Tax=Gossypium australe TaxID=47621 RepID=A0A5B6V5I0_9ROSI|nr:hypothetical protein EPI10_008634 [Gossypium australe]
MLLLNCLILGVLRELFDRDAACTRSPIRSSKLPQILSSMDGTSAPASHIGVTPTSYSDLMLVEQEQGPGLALSLGHTLGLSYKHYQFVLKVRFPLVQAYSVRGRKGEMNSMQIYRKGTRHGDMMYIKIFKDDLNMPV